MSITMRLIVGKWKTIILFNKNPLQYSELLNKTPMVTERTLSLQLKTLETDDIIREKSVF